MHHKIKQQTHITCSAIISYHIISHHIISYYNIFTHQNTYHTPHTHHVLSSVSNTYHSITSKPTHSSLCVCSLSNDWIVLYSHLLPPSHLHLVSHTFFPPSFHHLPHFQFLQRLFCFYFTSLSIPPSCLPSTFSRLLSIFLTPLTRFLHRTGMPCPGATDRSAPVPYWHCIFEGHSQRPCGCQSSHVPELQCGTYITK